MFSLICAWTNGWVNNRDAGDLRRHCDHYDVTLMEILHLSQLCTICMLLYLIVLYGGSTVFCQDDDIGIDCEWGRRQYRRWRHSDNVYMIDNNHCGLITSYDVISHTQQGFRWSFVAWRHRAIIFTSAGQFIQSEILTNNSYLSCIFSGNAIFVDMKMTENHYTYTVRCRYKATRQFIGYLWIISVSLTQSIKHTHTHIYVYITHNSCFPNIIWSLLICLCSWQGWC